MGTRRCIPQVHFSCLGLSRDSRCVRATLGIDVSDSGRVNDRPLPMAGLRGGSASYLRLPGRDVHELRSRLTRRGVVFGGREASLPLRPWVLARTLGALLLCGPMDRRSWLVGRRGDAIRLARRSGLGSRTEQARPGRVGLRWELAFKVLLAARLSTLPEVRWGHAWRQRHRQGRRIPPGSNRFGPRATSCSLSALPVSRFGSQGNVGTAARRAEVRLWGAGGNAYPSVLGPDLVGPRLRVRPIAKPNRTRPRCRLTAPPCRPRRRADLRIRVDVDHPGFDQLRAVAFIGDRCKSCSGVDCPAAR
jgi:hypothetical protein